MADFSRRHVVGAGLAAGVGAPSVLTAAAASGSTRSASGSQRLWYRQPAKLWTEALPIGNGRIGAMIFGGVARERVQMNEDTLYSGGPYNPVNPKARGSLQEVRNLIFSRQYAAADALTNSNLMAVPLQQAAYQALGDLFIDWLDRDGANPSTYARELDLDSAVASTRYTLNGVTFSQRAIASPADQVIAIEIDCDRPRSISCTLSLTSPQKQWSVRTAQGGTLVLTGRNGDHATIPGVVRFEARVQVKATGGLVRTDGQSLIVEKASSLVILIALATSFRRFDDVSGDPEAANITTLRAATTRGFSAILEQTKKDHQKLFRRVSIDLGSSPAASLPTDVRIAQSEQVDDPALAALYFDYGRYLLICSSRSGSQPANLQGIWNESINPPWGSKYTININTQMNYWPAERLSLPECVEPLERMVRELSISGARTAKEMYGARGWVVHHNTDIWRATAPIDGARWGMWPTGGAWLCTHLWDHYRFSRDKVWLKSIYPILKGAALFFLDTLQVDPESGHLVTNPSSSPENTHGHGSSLIQGPAMDMQILRDLFGQVANAADVLGEDKEFAGQVRQARSRLLPDRIGSQGQLQEWPYDWDSKAEEPDHRHVSHLYGIYPSQQINMDRTPAFAAAARRSLELRGDRATGWATAWRINLWARLRDGDRAHSILRFLLGPKRTYPNMFDAHPPFQIDGNFGGAAGIAEMLVQEDDDAIWLLPALPSAWPTGRLNGVRLIGGARLNLAWMNGQLDRAEIIGGTGLTREVRLRDGKTSVWINAGKKTVLTPASFA